MKPRFLFWLFFIVFPLLALAQDSLYTPVWKAGAIKESEGRYKLQLTTSISNGWQLYQPGQVLLEMPVASLQFADSLLKNKDLIATTPGVKTKSEIFGQEVILQDGEVIWTAIVTIEGQVPAQLQGTLQYTYGKGDEYYPSTPFHFTVELEGGKEASSLKRESVNLNQPLQSCGDEAAGGQSLFTIFLLGILGGLIALLTPCVFPMVPVTVTFFTKKSHDKKKGRFNATLYGLFILLIYVLITIPFHVAGKAISPEIFNNISTNVWLNLLFFAVFVAFALSFFGLFEIGLPSSLANRMDSKSGLGNIGGIFFMASTLAIVSFSCTGPILGTLLVGVADQGAWPLTVGAAGFGVALGLPFALFAMFPHWLQSLPRSGGWMTDVKVILGFVELALAVKFLSNADLVEQWGVLKREIFIGLWILIGVLMVLYLLGWLRMADASPIKKFSVARISFLVLFGAFTIYLLPGVTNTKWADLKLISGFPPPLTYSIYPTKKTEKRSFAPLHNDYEAALKQAKLENKPVLIDFTGWACVNCRRMEEKVWPDPLVDSLMRKEFVVVSLYVDERTNLPLSEQQVVTMPDGSSRPIVTVGDKWASFQIQNFGATSQPQYAILSGDEQLLTKPKFYTPNAEEFAEWLQCGLSAFQQLSTIK
ncbi:MAG: protein-disulfide reductase DsbD family protein [Chitinophagaceae bacterium]